MGVDEARGSATNHGSARAPDEVRRRLYRLKRGAHAYRVADLGNLRPGQSADDTRLRLREVCATLMGHGVMPIILGGTHDLDYGQYGAYESLEKPVSVVTVDATLDLHQRNPAHPADYHLQQILLHDPNYLFHYAHLAHQAYLVPPDALAVLENLQFEARSVGQLRHDFAEAEPLVRYADMLSFDLSAVRMGDAPGNANAQPFGLTGEEACQLCWYAGLNEKMTSVGFYEYHPALDTRGQTAALLATMVWYVAEGFYNRQNEGDFATPQYTRYHVPLRDGLEPVLFYKSNRSEKWWMAVPYPNQEARHYLVPCSYADYQTATQGELPQRWLTTYAKLN